MDNLDVGTVVKSYMNERALTYRSMAEQINALVDVDGDNIISHQTLVNWAEGINLPAVDTLAKILETTSLDDWRGQFVRDVLAALFPDLISHTHRFDEPSAAKLARMQSSTPASQ